MAVKTTWHHIRRSPYQALAAILIMMLTFLAVSVFTFLILGSSKIISYFESKPQVTVFFHNEAKQSSIDQLQADLQASGKISFMRFVSKEEALQIYKQQNKNDPLLLDLVTADILPASLEISTKNLSDLAPIADTLTKNPIVLRVVFQKEVASTLATWTNALREIGIALILILTIVSVVIMSTVIGMKISQKREEVEVMRLIGATKWYVSYPFILEGIFYALVGAVIGWILSSVGLIYASPYLESFLRGIPLLPVSYTFYAELLGFETILAIILGSVASAIAVSRYLK